MDWEIVWTAVVIVLLAVLLWILINVCREVMWDRYDYRRKTKKKRRKSPNE